MKISCSGEFIPPSSSRCMYLLGRTALLLAAAILLWAGAARAADVIVDCTSAPGAGEPPRLQIDLNSLDPNVPNTITITGNCQGVDGDGNPNSIQIDNFTDLTIQGGENATISLVGSCASGVPGPSVLQITNSYNIVFIGPLTIQGGNGVAMNESNVRFLGGVTVQDSSGTGVSMGQGCEVEFRSTPEDGTGNVIDGNCGAGVAVGFASRVRFIGNNTVSGNRLGVLVGIGGSSFFSAGNTPVGLQQVLITNNDVVGVNCQIQSSCVVLGNVESSNNGVGLDPTNPSFRLRGGIFAQFGAVVVLAGGPPGLGPAIEFNGGPGIFADAQTLLFLQNSTVNNNSENGIHLLNMSLAKFDLGVTASGNGGFDLLCDESARAVGDLAGIGTNQCTSALPGMAPGPPMMPGGPGGGGPP